MTRIKRRPAPCVVGIDQSLTGFAVTVLYHNGQHVVYRKGFPADQAIGVDRLAKIGMWLVWVLNKHEGIEHICMEGYARERRNGREEAGELGAIVKMALRTHPRLRTPICYPTIVTPNGLKKYVTGNGRGKKSDMKLHVFKKWGVEFSSDDEADSYGLARMASAIQWQKEELFEYQKDALKAIRHHTELKLKE